ncbi:MAG: hypothetical protein ABEJ79_00015 [Halolamina sp.]
MDDHDDHGHGHESPGMDRVTSPMQSYGTTQVALGAAVAAVGLVVGFGLPLLLA